MTGRFQQLPSESCRPISQISDDVARQASQNELVGRGLNIRLQDFFPLDELNLRELVTIRKFRDLPDALLAKGSLDSAGIECFLLDDNMVRLDWFISNLSRDLSILYYRITADHWSEIIESTREAVLVFLSSEDNLNYAFRQGPMWRQGCDYAHFEKLGSHAGEPGNRHGVE